MSVLDEIIAKRESILALGAEYGATNFRIFGSVLEGKENPNDIDFLIDYTPPADKNKRGWHFYGLETDLSKMLGTPVHLTQAKLLKPHYAPYILPVARPI